MIIEIPCKRQVDVKFLQASCHVRYWEDAEIDGEADEHGTLTPCRNGASFEPLIDLETGIILNWDAGKVADIHFKICDAGEYALLDANRNEVKRINGYVPPIMYPEGEGYGDYVIMKVDADGKIAKWKADLDKFTESDD